MQNLHKSKIFYRSVCVFLAGVGSAYFFYIRFSIVVFLFLTGIFFVLFFLNYKILKSFQCNNFFRIIFYLICFIGGNIYFQIHDNSQNKNQIHAYIDENVLMYGQILDEVDARIDHSKLIVTVNAVSPLVKDQNSKNESFGDRSEISGKILLKVNRFPRFQYGDTIKFKCKIQEPKVFDEFDYKKYLQRYKIYSICYYPKIEKIHWEEVRSHKNKSFLKNGIYSLFKVIFWVKQHFERAIAQTIHEPYASFLAGLLLGVRRGITPKIMDAFNVTGTTHIIAVSGYNISLIASILLGLAPRLYISRKLAIKIVLVTLCIFTIITGMSASVVRAAIMGSLVILARFLGRQSDIKNIIVLTVLLMTLGNPYILMFDIGFHLSLFSTLGLIYIHPVISIFCQKIPERFGIRESFTSTIASMIGTFPFVYIYFGRVSFISILVNCLILSVLPFAMFFGFLGVIISWFSLDLAQAVQWITFLILKYVIDVIILFAY